MRGHLIAACIILLLCPSRYFAGESLGADDSRYVRVVRSFADNVLKHGKDVYGEKQTPLFVDGLNINTH
jgi:hypothetical protein